MREADPPAIRDAAPGAGSLDENGPGVGETPSHGLRRIAFLGNYLPRRCGLATFTTDLCEAFAAGFPGTECFALAMHDHPEGYAYPPAVRLGIPSAEPGAYLRAAEFLERQEVDVLCVQHEFGIYGGAAGSHLLALLDGVRVPVVTTLHTVLREPDAAQRWVMRGLARRTDRFVVMTRRAEAMLREVYGVPAGAIDVIPHGIPDVGAGAVAEEAGKSGFGVPGRTVLLTFGLLGPGKGIENVIEALPAILARHPEAAYLVLGATHPHVLAAAGESYRHGLARLARERGVADRVVFHDRFASAAELNAALGAADVYISPYPNPAQSTSGTLARAFGVGKAVVSTPFWHAEELLADGNGALVPFSDPPALAAAVNGLLADPARLRRMRANARRLGREMLWPRVARRYAGTFARTRAGHRVRPARTPLASLPVTRLDHLRRLTDHVGLFQHATFDVPNLAEGYCTDDNARACVLVARLRAGGAALPPAEAAGLSRLGEVYGNFLRRAWNPAAGRFRNFLDVDGRWLEEVGSEDCHGRAVWALGVADPGGRLFAAALPAVREFTSPRAWASALLGLHAFSRRFPGDRRPAADLRGELSDRLLGLLRGTAGPGWPWFENILSYENALLPRALLLSGRAEALEPGLRTLRWLLEIQTTPAGSHFSPVGSHGFYPRGGPRARFDQQPIEAGATVEACLEAHRGTGDPFWSAQARRVFEWFLGRNDLGLPLYDPTTGGCRDGLHADRANENQGAESTLAFHLALAGLRGASAAEARSAEISGCVA